MRDPYQALASALSSSNLTCLWGFFSGSTYNYSCGGYPGQAVVPYENDDNQFLQNDIWSPWITTSSAGRGSPC